MQEGAAGSRRRARDGAHPAEDGDAHQRAGEGGCRYLSASEKASDSRSLFRLESVSVLDSRILIENEPRMVCLHPRP